MTCKCFICKEILTAVSAWHSYTLHIFMNVFTYNVTIICDHKVISIISVLMFHLSLCFWYLVIIFRRLEFDTTPKIIFFIIHDHKIGLPLLVTLYPSIYSFTISILVFAEASYYDGIWVQFADKMHDFGGKVIFILYFKVFRYSFFFFFPCPIAIKFSPVIRYGLKFVRM